MPSIYPHLNILTEKGKCQLTSDKQFIIINKLILNNKFIILLRTIIKFINIRKDSYEPKINHHNIDYINVIY